LSTAVKELRRAFEEHDTQAASFIQTFSRRGYRFVADVSEELWNDPQAARRYSHGGTHSTPLSGRTDELRILARQLDDLRQGRGNAVVVVGEAGIGKTALLDDQAVRALANGIHVARTPCEPIPGSPALWPFIQLLREIVGATDGTAAAQEDLGRLLLRAGVAVPGTDAGHDGYPAQQRFLCFDAVMRVVTARCRERPILIVMEDLHWADPPSVELIGWMIPRLRRVRVALLASARPGPRQLSSIIEASERLDLSRLAKSESAALVLTAERDLSPRVVDWIVDAAAGHPQRLEELAHMAARRAAAGDLTPEDLAEYMPSALASLVSRRFAELSARCRDLLGLCACLGSELNQIDLHAISGMPPETLQSHLDEGVSSGLLLELHPSGRYRVAHEVLAVAVTRLLPHAVRTAWHGKIAAHIARTLTGVVEAEALNDQRAAELVIDSASRVELLIQHARRCAALGASSEALRSSYAQAFELATEIGYPSLMARSALAYSGCELFRSSSFSALPFSRDEIQLLQKASEAQHDGTVWRVLIEARLGVALCSTDQVQEGLRLTQRAVAMATATGDAFTLCEALLQRSRSLAGPGQARQRAATAEEALAIAERIGCSDLVHDARFERATARLRMGEMTAAELSALARPGSDNCSPAQCLRGAYWHMLQCLLAGEIDLAEQELAGFHDGARKLNPIAAERIFPAFEIQIDRIRGSGDAMTRLAQIETSRFTPAASMKFFRLFALLEAGDLRRARIAYRALLQRLQMLVNNQYFLPSMSVAVVAANRFSDRVGARTLYDQLVPYNGELITAGDGLLVFAPVAHYLSVAALLMGDKRRARAHLEEAHAQNERLNAVVPQLMGRQHQAQLLHVEGDHAAAKQQLAAVSREMRARGLDGLIDEPDFTVVACAGAPARDVVVRSTQRRHRSRLASLAVSRRRRAATA